MRGRLAGVASEEDDAFLEGMLRVAHEQELWGSLLPIVRDTERQARRRFAALPAFHNRGARRGLLDQLGPLGVVLDPSSARRLS